MKITGRVEVLVNGKLMLTKSGATATGIGVSGKPAMERVPVLGIDGLHGAVENPIEAAVELTITDRDDISLSDLAAINGDGTVIFRTRGGGKVYTMEGAYCTMNIGVAAGEGETGLKFFGPYWVETTSDT